MRRLLVLGLAGPAALAAAACGGGGSAGSAGGGGDAGASVESGAANEGGADATSPPADGGTSSEAAACAPAVPHPAWTSPYAGFSRGVPTDPSFFPIAVWLQGPWHATELAGLGANVFVGNNAGTDPIMASDLATLKGLGMYAIVGQDSVGLANVDDPTIIGWWMTPDEPDNAQPSPDGGGYGPPVDPATLVARYQGYRKADPTRPVWLGLGQGVAYDGWEGRGSSPPPESGYVAASDIVSFDIYPYNNCGGDKNEQVTCGQFWLNALGVDRLHQWSTRHQAVWSDFETTVISAGSTSGPTPAETASEVWLALIHGANGVLYFLDTWNPSFREDGIFANPAMVTAVTALDKQILSLAPLLNSGTLDGFVSVSTPDGGATVDAMVKSKGTVVTVFAAASRPGATSATFSIAGLTGDAKATVLGEGRTVAVKAGRWTDAFAASAVHLYELDLSAVTCP